MTSAEPMDNIANSDWARYCEYTRQGALRWLHGIDFRVHSPTYGVCDREYWAWKTKDFSNGTLQAGIAGFLDALPLLDLNEDSARCILNSVLRGTKNIQRANGSFEEAYPLESSYAVTGLVLFALLYSRETHSDLFDAEAVALLEQIADRAAAFLAKTPETHGEISNHVMTTLGALYLHDRFRNPASTEPWEALEQLLNTQNTEGWFSEYGGPDPGYQTLLNHYWTALTTIARERSDDWQEQIEASYAFLEHFALPGGSFAGEIGSRGTSIVYPSGLVSRYGTSEMARWFFQEHLHNDECVGPAVVDNGNLVPVFNSWAYLFRHWQGESKIPHPRPLNHSLSEAGLLVWETKSACLILNLTNGSYRLVRNQNGHWEDHSIVSYRCNQRLTQLGRARLLKQEEDEVELQLYAVKAKHVLNTGFRSALVRFASSITVATPVLQRGLKKSLSKIIMTSGFRGDETDITINFRRDNDTIVIKTHNPSSHPPIDCGFYRHMASANTFRPKGFSINKQKEFTNND